MIKYKDILIPFIGSVILIMIGAIIYPKFLSFPYLLQQLKIASFLGVIAVGATLVILLGHIDLSVPWVFTGAAIISTTIVGTEKLVVLAVPLALLFGVGIGFINAVGVALLRIPSMVWTLAINSILLGVAVFYTGGYNPQGNASDFMKYMAEGDVVGVPIALLIWMFLCTIIFLVMKRTPLGKYLSAVGYSEKATFLSGVSTNQVTFGAFMIAGFCSALGGILLAGYADQAYQSMGDPYLMPTIAAVVIGGTSILGGKGSFIGTVGGAIFITLLTSILSVMQLEQSYKQIIFGTIIIVMLLFQRQKQNLL